MSNDVKSSFGLAPSLAAALRKSMAEGSRLMQLATQRMREQHAELRSGRTSRGGQ
jgi:hypothetical protein